MSDENIFPNCEGCENCKYFVMKVKCMEIIYGKEYVDTFFSEAKSVKQIVDKEKNS